MLCSVARIFSACRIESSSKIRASGCDIRIALPSASPNNG